MVRSTIALLVLGSVGVAAGFDAWHPEWGPSPPVAPYGMGNLPSEKVTVSLIFPVLGASRWQDGYNEPRGKFRHTGIDIKAPKMTPIVAPFSGKLGMKTQSFWIYGDNGWMMLGTHLNDDNVGTRDHKGNRDVMFAADLQAGQHVVAGQFIGYVGESGDATAPHLHFEIYAPGRGPTAPRIRNPFPSLKAAKIIATPKVVLPDSDNKPAKGEVRLNGCIRKVDEQAGTVTILLSAIQYPSGQAIAVTTMQYRRVKVALKDLQSAGGWYGIRSFAPYQTMSAYVPESSATDIRVARTLTFHPR